jgi:anti-anti-sigma factor
LDDTAFQVTTKPSPDGGLVLAVEGYLDKEGGSALVRETRSAPATDRQRVCIDLNEVCLFNCSGARCLIEILRELERQGYEVELVGVHPPLQKILDIVA